MLRRIRGATVGVCVAAAGIVAAMLFVGSAEAGEVVLGERTLRVPDGFEVERVAGPPLVDRPISVSFDEQGRLYVTDSAGLNDRGPQQLEAKPHRIVRLEDLDGDGRFDRSVVFADRMMFPEGCLWHAGSLYVAAPPEIWKLTDTDGDGRADERTVWLDGKTLGSCANDLHGPYLGRDGWFYWCKGAWAEQHWTLPSGRPFVTRAAHIFRARPEGGAEQRRLEPVLTGGMDNPVGVAFLSTGERILSSTFFQHPAAGLRDGLIHAIYGGVYGKKHDVYREHPQTGDVLPVLVHQGAAAPCGLTAGSDTLFGGGHGDRLYACYFNLHRVVEHELRPEGATYSTRDRDLLSCEHPDFHPTDVCEDADGSLLVVDTGGWYKICCPTSQIAKPDVLGAIYRVRRSGAPRPADPYGLKLDWAKATPATCVARLSDTRLFVRRRAESMLRSQGSAAVEPLAARIVNDDSPTVRRDAVWTLAAIDRADARIAVHVALSDRDPSVAHAACHVAGLHRDRAARAALETLLSSPDASHVRAAAEALGRTGDPASVPALLAAVERGGPFEPDAVGAPREPARRILEHSLIYALIEIAAPEPTARGLNSSAPQVRRAALVALDQMAGHPLEVDAVLKRLGSSDPVERLTAGWIIAHRPEWGPRLVEHFRRHLVSPPASNEGRDALVEQLAGSAASPEVAVLLAAILVEGSTADAQQVVLRAMRAAKGTTAPSKAWFDALADLAGRAEGPVLEQIVTTAGGLAWPKEGHAGLAAALRRIGGDSRAALEVRLAALVAAGPLPQVEPELFDELARRILPGEPWEVRSSAATVLVAAKLSRPQRERLVELLPQVDAFLLPKLLPVFAREPETLLGLRLVSALERASGAKGLRRDLVQPILAKHAPEVQQAGTKLLAALDKEAASQAEFLDRVAKELPAGDARRGQAVFQGKKVSCAACHTVGYVGGRLGPDLTRIGKVRTDRDLLESIVFPSATLVRSYEPVLVVRTDGRTVAGIVTAESREEVVLSTAPQQTVRIPRSEIEELHPSPVSLMPQGVATLLTRQELADLLTFLRETTR